MGGSKALKSGKGSSAVAKTGKKEKQKAAKDKKKAKKATIAPAHQDLKASSSNKPTNKSTSSTKKSDGPRASASATMRVSKKSSKADAPKSAAGASSSSSTKKTCGALRSKMKMIRGTTTTSTSTAGGGKDKDKDEQDVGGEAESGGSSSSSSSASSSSSSCSGSCSSNSKKPVFSEADGPNGVVAVKTKTSLMKTDRITGAESSKKSKRPATFSSTVGAEEFCEKVADGAEAADSKCAAAPAAGPPPAKRSKKTVENVEAAALEVGKSGHKGIKVSRKTKEKAHTSGNSSSAAGTNTKKSESSTILTTTKTVAASSATAKRNSSKKNTSTSSKAVVGNGRTPAAPAPAASASSIAKPPTAPIYNTSTTTLTRSTHYIHIEPWTFDDEFFFGHKKALNGGNNDENDGEASTDKDEDSDDNSEGCGEKEDHVHEDAGRRRFGDLWADDSDEEKCSASADKNPSSSTAGPQQEQPGTEQAQQQVYRIGGRRAHQDQDHDPHGATTSDGRRFQSRPPSTSASMDDDIGRVEQDGCNFPTTYEKPASTGPFRPNTKSMKSSLSWCSSSAKMRSSQNVQQVFVARDREDRDSPSATTCGLTSSSSSTEGTSRNCNILHRVVDHPHLPPFQMSQTADNRNLTTTLERIIHDLEDNNEIDKKKNDAKHVFVVNLEYTQTKDYTDHEDCLGVYTNVKEANWAVVDFLDKWSYEPAFRKIRDNLLANKVKMGGGEEVEEDMGERLYDISLNESGRLFEGEKIRIFGEKFALNAPARY